MTRNKILAILAFGLISITAVEAGEILTWEACVTQASQNNPELLAAQASLRSAEYQTKAAGSGFLPQVSASVNYTDENTSVPAAASSSTANYSAAVTATQNIFSGFQDKAKLAQGTANQEAAQANLDSIKAKVSFDLKSAFAALLYAQNYLKLTDDIIRRREENMRLVELRFEGGRENKGSFLLSRASLSQAKLDNLQAQHALQVAQEQLANALGKKSSSEVQIAGSIPLKEPETVVDLEQLALQTPDHRQVSAQEKSATAGVSLAQSPLYPSLNLTGTSARQGNNWIPDNNRHSVGVSLSIPLYNGGRDYYGTRSAVNDLSAATYNRERVDQQLITKLRQASTGYIEAVEKLKVDQSFVEAATARAEIARNKYDNGLISFEDWDIIENDLISRQKTLVQSQRDRIVSEASWEQIQGKGVIP
ncbi:MAG: TolC family protein [Gammaproteobacteria bacterium]|nr:TolC family protein [Gammaproteobacteria bacterium]